MSKKDRRATEKLSIALSGIESCLTIMEQTSDGEQRLRLIDKAQGYANEARDALLTIQHSLGQL